MNKTVEEAIGFLKQLGPRTKECKNAVYLAPPFTAIYALAKEARERGIVIGGQNMHDHIDGAFTGEVSASMLKDAGAQFVILGHSERRLIFGEGNRFINRKVLRALQEGLQPILCVGETEHERKMGVVEEVLGDQLLHSLEDVKVEDLTRLIVAYEPVWAIGTGQTATPEQAQDMHSFCRKVLKKRFGSDDAEKIPILYGGSVNPSNIRELLEKPDIDGALIGGASLDAASFLRLINYQTINV